MKLRPLIILFFLVPGISSGLLDNITISGNPSPMTISTAVAGSQPNSVTDTSTTYSVQTSLLGRKITGQLSANMPTGLTLKLQLQAPTGGTSQGSVTLSTTAADLVTNVPLLVILSSNLQMTYTLSATVSAAPAAAQTRTLTLTLL